MSKCPLPPQKMEATQAIKKRILTNEIKTIRRVSEVAHLSESYVK